MIDQSEAVMPYVGEAGVTAREPVITVAIAIEAVRKVLPAKRRDLIQLSEDTRFDEDLGLTSLDLGEVFVRLEELAGLRLDTSQIETTRRIGDLLLVDRASEERAW